MAQRYRVSQEEGAGQGVLSESRGEKVMGTEWMGEKTSGPVLQECLAV